MSYIGRFAPSPTGLLHFGSLIAALASFLDARANKGQWLLRIEDIDPPREHPDARSLIPDVLQQFGLHWDGEITYQSDRHIYYHKAIQQLLEADVAYRCNCSRKQIRTRTTSKLYDGHCITRPPAAELDAAIRVIAQDNVFQLIDSIQGTVNFNLIDESGDYIVHRKDGLFSYQLAVVIDDYMQNITHVVRGSDLLEETPRQQQLQHYLHLPAVCYSHLPIACNPDGQKLSKQNLALPLNTEKAELQLISALQFLGQNPPPSLTRLSKENILLWAVEYWQPNNIPKQRSIVWQG